MKGLEFHNSNVIAFPTNQTMDEASYEEEFQKQRAQAWVKAREDKLKKRFYAFFTDLFII